MKSIVLKSSISLLAMVLFISTCNAQRYGRVRGDGNVINDTRQVGNFDNVAVSGSFDVNLVKGKEGKVDIKIEKNLLPYLITEVDGGKLKIKWKKGTSISSKRGVKLTVYFKEINGVRMSGSGDIVSTDVMEADDFNVAVSGSGDISLVLDVNNMDARVSGSGDLDFKGSATHFTAAVSGSGDIEAYGLKTNSANVRISGSGDMTLSVKDKLYARVSGSGGVSYKGNPSKEDVKVSGSGDVSSRN